MLLKLLHVTGVSVLLAICVLNDVSADVYVCHPNGSIAFTSPNSTLYPAVLAYYTNGTSEVACTTTGTDIALISNCDLNYTVTVVFSDRPDASDMIMGGIKILTYLVKCNAIVNSTVTELAAQFGVTQPARVFGNGFPRPNINAGFYDQNTTVTGSLVNKASVGELIYFIIIIPEQYFIKPVECVATDTAARSSATHIKTLIDNGCKTDYKLMGEFVRNDGEYVASFYTFKFYGIDELYLECSITVCQEATDCDNTCGRKRRQLVETSNTVTASISRRLLIVEGIGNGSASTHGIINWIVLMICAIIVVRTNC